MLFASAGQVNYPQSKYSGSFCPFSRHFLPFERITMFLVSDLLFRNGRFDGNAIIQGQGADMVSPIDSGLSGVAANMKKMEVTANNVANVNTDGFKKSRATFKEGAAGGVSVDVSQVNTPGTTKQVTEKGRIKDVETSNVDLAEEFTESMSTRTGYKANLKTIRTHDEMLGNLLDTLG
jgi:flagellar hook protein FlgE